MKSLLPLALSAAFVVLGIAEWRSQQKLAEIQGRLDGHEEVLQHLAQRDLELQAFQEDVINFAKYVSLIISQASEESDQ